MFSKIAIILVALAIAEANVLPVVPVSSVVDEDYAPQPYAFGYKVKDNHSDQYREEVSDGVAVKGSYGFTDIRGIRRMVNYIADHAGFRAEVLTNEPGTANENPAAVKIISEAYIPIVPVDTDGPVVVDPVIVEPVIAEPIVTEPVVEKPVVADAVIVERPVSRASFGMLRTGRRQARGAVAPGTVVGPVAGA